MVVTIGVDHLLKFYSDIKVGRTGIISLTSTTGQLRVRYPHLEQEIGRDLSSTPILRRNAAKCPAPLSSFRD